MPRPIAHRFQRNPRREEQRNIRVPQRMNRNLRQIGARNEIVEPTRYAVRVNRCAVILRKNPVAVNPAITHSDSLFPLPFAVLFKKFECLLRQLDRADRRIRLGAFCKDALLRQILRRPAKNTFGSYF